MSNNRPDPIAALAEAESAAFTEHAVGVCSETGWTCSHCEQERYALRSALARVRTHNGTPVTVKNLRWAATHEALSRSFIFDVLTALADRLEEAEDA